MRRKSDVQTKPKVVIMVKLRKFCMSNRFITFSISGFNLRAFFILIEWGSTSNESRMTLHEWKKMIWNGKCLLPNTRLTHSYLTQIIVSNLYSEGNRTQIYYREFKMLRRQRDHDDQNKIIHTNGSKENLLFIINRMILIQKKKLMIQPLCRGRVLLNRI